MVRRLLPLVLLLTACAPAPAEDVVVLDTGAVRGAVDAGNRVFRDLPFAAPPIGELRWEPPRPPAAWDGVRDATASGPPCPQAPKSVAEIASEDEDCLTLEVTTPREPGPPRPVLVWVHGGTGTNGAGSAFDARRFARDGDAVLVTVNYRLGVFGAFGHPDLPEAGTLGLADQQAALGWVRRNIAAFGGDPEAVTVFGESYGAYALTAQLTSPGAAGLFRGAVLQSGLALHDYPAGTIAPGSPPVPTLWATRSEVEALGASVAEQLGCADVACLRALPVRDSSEVFGQFDAPGSGEFGATAGAFSPAQRAFAGELNRTWAAFARTGDPGWDAGIVQSLAPGASGPVDHAAEHRLGFWDRIAAR